MSRPTSKARHAKVSDGRPAPILPANDTRDFSTTGRPGTRSPSHSKPAPPHPESSSVSRATAAPTKLSSRPAPPPPADDTRDYSTTGAAPGSTAMTKRRGSGGGRPPAPPKPRGPTVHQTAVERFRVAVQANSEQRKREYDDLKFAAGDQWPDDVKAQRAGGQAFGSLPPQPARPMITVDKLRQPLRQLSNMQKQARLSVKFSPKGDGATKETASLFEDIARAIQADSRAHLARSWAFDRAMQCGRGFYRLLYEEDYETGELEIVYKRILNQAGVYLDPFATEPDWSDGEWGFIVEWYSVPRYRREFGESKLAAALNTTSFSDLADDNSEWFRDSVDGTEAGRAIQVAEYFYKTWSRDDYGRRSGPPTVQWCKLNGKEVLQKEKWAGICIPIIPVTADEFNLNGERRWEGIVRPARGACQSYNFMRSAQIETIGLASRSQYILDPKSIAGYEDWWRQHNMRNFPYLPAASFNERGQPYREIKRQIEEPAIQAITLATREADNDIKAVSGFFDPSLGNMSSHERSGKAVLALQKQQELGSGGYIGNLADCSMLYEAKVLKNLIPKIYNDRGRIVATIGEDDQRGLAMIGVPFKTQGGQPTAVPQGTPGAKFIDLEQGAYTVSVSVGKSYTTRREEAVSSMGDVADAAPALVPSFADIWVKNMDFPGATQIADRLHKALPPQFQDDQGDQPPIPPQLLQQMQFAQKMIDELSAQNKQLTEMVQTKQVEKQADLEKADRDNQTRIEIAKIQAGASLGVADIKAQIDAAKVAAEQLRTIVQAAEEQRMSARTMGHETALATQDKMHQTSLAAQQHAQTLEQGQQAHQQTLEQQQHAGALTMDQADQQHGHALEQNEQAAELAPEPTEGD